MNSTLEELYTLKEETSDKKELRQIRHRIRKHLKARGQYVGRTERVRAKQRVKKESKGSEEKEEVALRARVSKEERERKAGHRAERFWRSLTPLHSYVCRCSKCTIGTTTTCNKLKPPFNAWYTIILRRGLKIRKEQMRPAYEKIRKGEKPTKDWSLFLRELMRASGWF